MIFHEAPENSRVFNNAYLFIAASSEKRSRQTRLLRLPICSLAIAKDSAQLERLLRTKKRCKPYSSVSSKAKLACRKRLDEIAGHQSQIAIQVFQIISKFMESLEPHQIAYLGVCCTTEQKDLLLMTRVVKNFFGNEESKTELVSVCGVFVVQVNEVCRSCFLTN